MYIRPSFLTLVPDNLNTQEICNEALCIHPWLLYSVPDYLKVQETCNEAIENSPWLLFDVPDRSRNLRLSIRPMHPPRFNTSGHVKAQRACESTVKKTHGCWKMSLINSRWRKCVTRQCAKDQDYFKTQEMCIKAADVDTYALGDVPDHLKTHRKCDRVVPNNPYTLQHVPDHFKTQEICDKAIEINP